MSKVSIVIPIYKVPEEFLRKNIEQCINQTLKDIEIILVDDGSPDKNGAVCDEYAKTDNRIIVVHQKNAGLCAARNAGFRKAKSEYVMFIDGDDFIEKDACEYLYNKAEKDKPNVVISKMCKDYGSKIEYYNYDIYDFDKTYKDDEVKFIQEQTLNFKGNISNVNGKLIKRDFATKNNIYHNEELRQGAEGIEYFVRLFGKAKKVLLADKYLYHYCYNSGSITEKHSEKNHKMVLNCFMTIKNGLQEYDNHTELEKMFYQRMIYVIITTAISGYFSNTNQEAYKEQKNKFKKYLNEQLIRDTLRRGNTKKIDWTRKITYWAIKYRMYFLVKFISLLRNNQKNRWK